MGEPQEPRASAYSDKEIMIRLLDSIPAILGLGCRNCNRTAFALALQSSVYAVSPMEPLQPVTSRSPKGPLANFTTTTPKTLGLTTAASFTLEQTRNPNWPALFLVVFIFWGILGNSLVCLSILTDRKLQNATNHFLFSLALADFMVSICVMPFGLINEINNGVWTFSYRVCIVYVSGDVFFCSVSIVHMSVISFDRYWGISRPFKTAQKSQTTLFLKIIGCWTVTIAISCPVMFLGILKSTNVYRDGSCQIFVPEFQIYGSIVTFFVPFLLMAFAYVKTVRLLKRQENVYKRKKHSDSAKPAVEVELIRRSRSIKTAKRSTGVPPSRPPNMSPYKQLVRRSTSLTLRAMRKPEISCSISSSPASDIPVTGSPRGSDCENQGTRVPFKSNLIRLQRFLSSKKRQQTENAVKSEQKATKVLGIVFVAFFICWVPFFAANMTLALCGESCARFFPAWLGTMFLWLGYLSSTVNPIIYTIFNKTFRRAFANILLCRVRICCPRSSNHIGSASKSTLSSINGISSKIAFLSPQTPSTPLKSVSSNQSGTGYGSCGTDLLTVRTITPMTSVMGRQASYRSMKQHSLDIDSCYRSPYANITTNPLAEEINVSTPV